MSDLGKYLRCKVTAHNAGGASAAVASNAVGPVTAAGPPGALVNEVPPVVSGIVADDEELSVDDPPGEWTGSGPITYSFQWYEVYVDDDDSPLLDDAAAELGMLVLGATSPTFVVGGIPVSPDSKWNFVDTFGEFNLTNGNLTAECSPTANGCGRGTAARSSGKRYLEFLLEESADTYQFVGLCNDVHTFAFAVYPGGPESNNGFTIYLRGFEGTKGISIGGVNGNAGVGAMAWVDGDVMSIAVDFATREAWFAHNGDWSYSVGDPTNPGFVWSSGLGPLKPYAELGFAAGVAGKITLRTKTSDFDYTPPTGFIEWEAPE